MKESNKEQTTSKTSPDYLKSKDAYDGNMKSSISAEPLPESARPRKDGPGGE